MRLTCSNCGHAWSYRGNAARAQCKCNAWIRVHPPLKRGRKTGGRLAARIHCLRFDIKREHRRVSALISRGWVGNDLVDDISRSAPFILRLVDHYLGEYECDYDREDGAADD